MTPESTSTSRLFGASRLLGACLLLAAVMGSAAIAADAPSSSVAPSAPAANTPSGGAVGQPEDEDLRKSPVSEYGEFNEQDEEDEVTRFLQFGRFFGVGLGGGFSTVTGNRGSVYQGGFPAFELKLQYWFDFDFALELGVSTASHFWDPVSIGHIDTSLLRLGIDLKYYIPVYNLAAPITFANPYLTLGLGGFRKTDKLQAQEVIETDSSAGLSLGAGLEFVVKPRATFFYVATKLHLVTFSDTSTTQYQTEGLENLAGQFITTTAGFLFTW